MKGRPKARGVVFRHQGTPTDVGGVGEADVRNGEMEADALPFLSCLGPPTKVLPTRERPRDWNLVVPEIPMTLET